MHGTKHGVGVFLRYQTVNASSKAYSCRKCRTARTAPHYLLNETSADRYIRTLVKQYKLITDMFPMRANFQNVYVRVAYTTIAKKYSNCMSYVACRA